MEFPARLDSLIERTLAVILLGILSVFCWIESRSTFACAVREGSPYLFWVALKSPSSTIPTPKLFLALYHPSKRALDLVYMPDTNPLEKNINLAKIYNQSYRETHNERQSARVLSETVKKWISPYMPGPHDLPQEVLYAQENSWPLDPEPALAAKNWLKAQERGLSFWALFLKNENWLNLEASSIAILDRFLLALEIHHLPKSAVQSVWLPEKILRRGLFGRLLAPLRPITISNSPVITAEVLNASQQKGLASQATKILRSKGADVVNYGNIAAPQSRTLIYDRSGRIENAKTIRDMLGCPAAETLTQINSKRLVDVSVILAQDCAAPWKG